MDNDMKLLVKNIFKHDTVDMFTENDGFLERLFEYKIKFVSCGYLNEDSVCYLAAKYGAYKILKYAYKNGYRLCKQTCYNAAGAHIECLKYAHENGCPWDVNTYLAAKRDRFNGCSEYVRKHGCPQN